jgi:hypothetical protein
MSANIREFEILWSAADSLRGFVLDDLHAPQPSCRMEDTLASDLDLISITQLRQVANQTPQPYRLHLQVESRIEKATSSGSPFYEVKLVDAGDSFVWRVFDNNPLFHDAAKLTRNTFIQLAGQWVDGKYGLEPRQVQMRRLQRTKRAPCCWAIPISPHVSRPITPTSWPSSSRFAIHGC